MLHVRVLCLTSASGSPTTRHHTARPSRRGSGGNYTQVIVLPSSASLVGSTSAGSVEIEVG